MRRPRRQLELPVRAESSCREAERDLLEVRVEEQQERVVAERLAVTRLRAELVAVQECADCARASAFSQSRRVIRRPSGRIHHTSGSCSPLPFEERRAPEDRMLARGARSAAS